MSAAGRLVVVGIGVFVACLGGCVAIDRNGLWDNHGWSYYGGRSGTAVLYGLGYASLVLCVLVAAVLLHRPPAVPVLPGLLGVLAIVLAGDLATPDTLSTAFYDAHVAASIVLFLFELGVAVWIAHRLVPTRMARLLLAAQFVGGLVAMFSQLQWIGLLGLGILVYQVCFFALLVLGVEHAAGRRDTTIDLSRRLRPS